MKRLFTILLVALTINITTSSPAYAGDGITLVFKSGVVVYFNNGYKQILDEVKKFNRQGSDTYMGELSIGGETMVINLAEVVILCRDRCSGMQVVNEKKR